MFLLLHLVLHLKKRTPNGRRQLLSFQRLERLRKSDNIAFEPLIIHHESPQTFAIKGVAGFLFLQKNKIALSTVTLIYHYYHFESGGQKNGKG